MRTSFKHHQLRTMKNYFAINQNPDAKDLKQLAQKTQLSKRVLQVWFQNARAKWRRGNQKSEPPQVEPGPVHALSSVGSPCGSSSFSESSPHHPGAMDTFSDFSRTLMVRHLSPPEATSFQELF
ncbi:LHX2 [Cordylochernes scorpioides]|uniref:LHX2 n=1 Tax=Cordylochernes scorpioides TaxID=51811 RepID=A0ABY6KNV9_9ARAC|nr:LHX2 [Cordylochernes scorpioides]